MLQSIVIMLKCVACIIGWANINTLNPTGKFLLQCLKGKQVVTMYEHVLSVRIAIRFFRIFDQDAGLELRPIVLADPVKFEFLFFIHSSLLSLVEPDKPQYRSVKMKSSPNASIGDMVFQEV